MKFEKDYMVGVKNIGVNSSITNYGFLSAMEEIASLHSESLGWGIKDRKKTKKAWILMDWKLKVLRRPKYGDTMHLKTWARKSKKLTFFTYREFEVFVGDEKVAIATSKWVLFDLEKNKISRITNDIEKSYEPEEERVFKEYDIEKIKEPIEYNSVMEYKIRRSDIDINKHMHNLNYLSLAYEALPEKVYNEPEKNNIRIMYKHEIILGQMVKCFYSNVDGKNVVSIKSADEKVLHAIIEMI